MTPRTRSTSPYEGVDLDAFPDWWRRNVEEFEAHGMRPYRPPRFADGRVTMAVITRLEERFGVRIRIRAVDPHEGGDWEVLVDGTPVETVERVRTEAGNSEYDLTAEAFERLVSDALAADDQRS
jgi:hypothetical protein